MLRLCLHILDLHITYFQYKIREIYISKTYKLLEDETTKMWHLGPVALYENMMGKD